MKKVPKRVISAVLVLVMVLSVFPAGMVKASATNKTLPSSEIANYFNAQVGKPYRRGYCLAFVADSFANLGAERSSSCCAYNYGTSHIVSYSQTNIPVGADIFLFWNGEVCTGEYSCGNYCGHIGVYVGDGYIVHAAQGIIKKEKLVEMAVNAFSYRGWGYHGNVIISDITYSTGWYKVITDYLNIRNGPSTNNTKVGQLNNGQKVEITTVSGEWGNIKGTGNWICLREIYVQKTTADIKPNAPAVNLSTPKNISTDSTATVWWNAVGGRPAPTYTAGLYNSSNVLVGSTKNVGTGTNVGFVVPSAGTYCIKVTASNSAGSSNAGISTSFTAHNPSTVTFKDWDGKILNTQSVKYEASAISPPAPSREGYIFIGWDKSFPKIISDVTINATYQIIKHTIKFTDMYGNILKTQIVPYGSDATPPTEKNPPTGYVFVDWSSNDYVNVKASKIIQARYKWGNTNLPIVASITSASRQPDGYYVYINLTNYPNAITRGRAVVTLKTAGGKLVDATESAAFSIPANGTKTGMEVFVPCDKAATTFEVLIVNSYSSGVPISLKKTTTINQDGMWSNWQDANPTGTGLTVESRTEYRYHDKEFSTATSKTKTGWILYNTTSSTGSWSAWSDGQYTAFENDQQKRIIQTQSVVAQDYYKTQYNYTRYYGWHNDWGYWVAWPSKSGYCQTYQEKGWSDATLPYANFWEGGSAAYGRSSKPSDPINGYNLDDDKHIFWYNQSTRSVYSYSTYKTQWRYQDTFFTYHFYRWPTTWSAWSPTQVTTTDNRQVQTKTTYRYKSSAAALEDNAGVSRTLSGTVDTGFAGKQASLFIYKVDEASDFTNEFVGQAVIGANGSYSFSYKLREEPTVKTGDFTIAIGIEGTTNTIVVGKITAPKPVYSVEFYDYDGSIVSTQQVEESGDAVLPENPSRAGYTFIGWDTGITNIRDNIGINARYIVNVFTVVFIDWTNDTVETRSFNYGDILTGPAPEEKEGYDFIGWDALLDGTTVITGNMILTASYEKKTYEVNFFDFDMNVISTQSVPYGESAIVPDDLTKENYIFLGWQAPAELTCVKQNLNINPNFIYDETVALPTANVESGVYFEDQMVTLNCDTMDATIYYSFDGIDPITGGVKYTIPIAISRGSELKFAAKAFGMNDSEIVSKHYAINKSNMVSKWTPYAELPDFVTENPAEFNVISGTGNRYKDIETTHLITVANGLESAGWSNDGFVSGDYTEWSMTQPNEPNAYIDIQMKDPDPVDTPFYRYSHWKYFDNASQSFIISRLEVPETDGAWEIITLPNVLTINGFESGQARYLFEGTYWYTQTVIIQGVVPDYKLYSYCYQEYTFSKWTDWSTSEIAPGETRETQTDTVLQYTVPNKYLISIISDGGVSTKLATENKLLNINVSDWQMGGYTFVGFFSDADCTQPWDLATDVVTDNLTLYPKWTINECTVNFVGFEGSDLGNQSVEYGSPAIAPVPEVIENYTFLGWDAPFNYVTADITITAQYKLTADVLKVALNMATNVLTIDSMFRIIADVTPAAAENKNLIWASSDEAVATVDQTGLVAAIGIGKATITATTEVDKQMASCVITVLSNGAWNFDFDQTSNLRFIIGLEAGNKVSDIKAQILNANLNFVGAAGQDMGDDDVVTTGCKVQMMEAQTVVAEKTFVFFGDVNSDGNSDSGDASVLVDYENYVVTWDPILSAALYAAADVNGDGTIDSIDAGIIVDAENFLVTIDQSTGTLLRK